MKDKFRKFLISRYGQDQLNKDMMVAQVVLFIIYLIFKKDWILYLVTALIIFVAFRMFSSDYEKRRRENSAYLSHTAGIRGGLRKMRNHIFGRDGYAYFTCKNCKTELRIPKNKGKIKVRCPKCHKTYIKRT